MLAAPLAATHGSPRHARASATLQVQSAVVPQRDWPATLFFLRQKPVKGPKESALAGTIGEPVPVGGSLGIGRGVTAKPGQPGNTDAEHAL